MNCIIIDDDIASLELLKGIVSSVDFLELKGAFSTSIEGLTYLSNNHVDLLFLDIEMPQMNGLELLKTNPNVSQIIIVSSNPSYAVEGYDFNVTDFLTKPISDMGRFMKSVLKAKQNLALIQSNGTSTEKETDVIFLKVGNHLQKVKLDTINIIEAYGDYIKVHTDNDVVVAYTKMMKIEELLPNSKFIRIHRSYIVKIQSINKIESNVLEISGKALPIGNSYRKNLLQIIQTPS